MKKVIYRTVVKLEILSETPINESLSLDEIFGECNDEDGEFSGKSNVVMCNKPVKGIKAVELIKSLGTPIEFFNIDEKGNEVDF